MALNFVYLKYFFDAIRLGGITAAAKENFVTQSAVSQGIMKLEHHFQKKLLTHKRRNLKLTTEGEKLFNRSKPLFQCIREIDETFVEEKAYRGKVEFACYYSIAVSFLPKALATFQQIAPEVKPHFITGPHEIVKKALKEGKAEFGILMDDQDLENYDCEPIHTGFFRVYESIKRDENAPIDKCIFTSNRNETLPLKTSYKKTYGQELHIQMEVSSWEVLVNLVMANVGIGFFPDYLAEVPYRKKFLRISLLEHEPIPYQLYAVIPKEEELSKNAQLLLQLIKNA